MTKEKPTNAHDRDHSVFPEIVTPDGEVLTPEFVAWSLSREGRRAIGKEFPNPVPLEPPIGYVDHVPLHIQIAQMVRQQLAQDGEEVETEEEANDFDADDDYPDPSSPWELQFEPTMPWSDAVKQIITEAEALGSRGGGGAEPPSGQPTSEAPASPEAPPSGPPHGKP